MPHLLVIASFPSKLILITVTIVAFVTVVVQPDIYTIASESEALGGAAAKGLRNRRARLVDICQATCLCPNCGGELIPLQLNEEERKRVRLGLMKIASTTSMGQLKNMQVRANLSPC